jgi:hypothetical protein
VKAMIKHLSINWNDPKDLKKYITVLQKRRKKVLTDIGYTEVVFSNTKYHIDHLEEAVGAFYNSIKFKETSGEYYVYFHCNPLEDINLRSKDYKQYFLATKYPKLRYIPFYVGKGKNNRYLDFNRNDGHRKIRTNILRSNKEICAVKIIEGISEESALQYENFFMYVLGIKSLSKHGFLCNLTENDNREIKIHLQKNEMMKKLIKKHNYIL